MTEQKLFMIEATNRCKVCESPFVADLVAEVRRLQEALNLQGMGKQLTLLTASYGMRIHPFYKTLQSHQGVDYTIPEGSRVFATADGVVRDVALRNSTSGQTVVIDHGNGFQSLYAHLSELYRGCGTSVGQGESIGAVGSTGRSSGSHLHFELMAGVKVNPWDYLPPP